MKRLPFLALVTLLWSSLPWSAPADTLDQGSLKTKIAATDEPGGARYTWYQALRACEQRGMVLPSPQEMALLFCHARVGKKISAEFPQTDAGCARAGASRTLPGFTAPGRYWTSSRYNAGVIRYLDFSDGRIGYYGKDERLRVRCIQPDLAGGEDQSTRRAFAYDINDVDRGSFDDIIATIFGLYAEPISQRDRELIINKRWDSEEENATSWLTESFDQEKGRVRRILEIELSGGLARHPMLNRDAYALVVCHEVGHHIGGAPFALGYSAEGQADYFAATKCMKRYLRAAGYEQHYTAPLPPRLEAACAASYPATDEQAICRRTILAGLILSRWFAHTREAAPTRLIGHDPDRPQSTLVHGYPSPQCRLDTFVAGALCNIDERSGFSEDDPSPGACTQAAGYADGARPRCWFNPDDS